MTTFSFTHVRFSGPSEHIPAMNEVKQDIADLEFSENVFAATEEYSNWETDEVIKTELFRNLGVSMACIFLTTLILLADIQVRLFNFFNESLMIIDASSKQSMHIVGLKLDSSKAVGCIRFV